MQITRRDLLQWTTGGLVARGTAGAASNRPPSLGIPGLYPASVIGVTHPGAFASDAFQAGPIQQAVRRGLTELTGAPDHVAAWKKFVQPGDRVGIKVNANGNELVRSSPYFLMEIINGLLAAGVLESDLVVFERYGESLAEIRSWFPTWVRLVYATPHYDDVQQDMAGYDSKHYAEFPSVLPGQDPKSKAARRSYAAKFVTEMVDKVVNCAVLKTHQASGVTLSLKNLSHGLANNANRSHPALEVNYLRDYIPAIVSMRVIRSKTVLNIVDGVNGLYHGGPYGYPEYVWQHQTIYVATDPVAVDRVCWRAIDEKRAAVGMPAVAVSPPDDQFRFLQRQPDHITNAGILGLGEWRDSLIQYRNVRLA